MILTLQHVYITLPCTFDTLYSTSRYISHFMYYFHVHLTFYITLPCTFDTIRGQSIMKPIFFKFIASHTT